MQKSFKTRVTEISKFLGGRHPRFLKVRESWPPRPPSLTPLRNRASSRGGQVSRSACLGRLRAPWPGSGHSGLPTATCSKLHWRGAGRFGQMKPTVHVQKSTQNSLVVKTKYTHLYELTYLYVFKKYNLFLKMWKGYIKTSATSSFNQRKTMKSPPRVCNKPTIKFIFVFCT